jgi:predicted RNA-binding Zn-ribbon protein involved in translation (DUF1610 family)
MEEFRRKLRIDGIGMFDVVFDNDYSGSGDFRALLNCTSCDMRLFWKESLSIYECPGCGVELTAQEAVDLCDKYVKLIHNLAIDSGKKKTFWQRIFK